MSKPEIARRCAACGASIREAASFCPQCGEHLSPQDSHGKPTTSVETTPLVEFAGGGEPNRKGQTEPDEVKRKASGNVARHDQQMSSEKPPVGKVRDKIQRATTLARGVEGDVIHRVQKVRQISSVVLDEAGYDPSLRFVLVAAALFLLFLLVLVLNKMIG
jgi:hypothetical protein